MRLIVLFILSLAACPMLGPATPKIGIEIPDESRPVVHVVRSKNESFNQISKWYTGKLQNSAIIAAYNNKSEKDGLRVGDSVVIPEYLVKVRKALPFAVSSEEKQGAKPARQNIRIDSKNEKEVKLKQEKKVPPINKDKISSPRAVDTLPIPKLENDSSISDKALEDLDRKQQGKVTAQPSQSLKDLDEKRRKYLVELHEMLNKD